MSSVFWGVTVCSSVFISDFYILGIHRSHLKPFTCGMPFIGFILLVCIDELYLFEIWITFFFS